MTLKEAEIRLKDAGIESYVWDARELYLYATGADRHAPIDKTRDIDVTDFSLYIERRASREPLQYIIGEVYFYRERYSVSPAVLIPRQDTEHLVDYAVKNIPEGEFFVDLCTGSGCIAISTLKNTNGTHALAVDVSEDALEVARQNAIDNSVADRLTLSPCNLLTDFPTLDCQPYAILSNPPYVTREAYSELEPEIYCEPSASFVAGSDGMEFYERLLPLALGSIKPCGFVAFEIGYDQEKKIAALADKEGAAIEIIKDYSGNPRVAVIRPK